MQKRSWKQMLVLLLAVCLFSTVSPELVSSAASTQKVQISARKMTLIKGQKKILKLKGNRKKSNGHPQEKQLQPFLQKVL